MMKFLLPCSKTTKKVYLTSLPKAKFTPIFLKILCVCVCVCERERERERERETIFYLYDMMMVAKKLQLLSCPQRKNYMLTTLFCAPSPI